MNRRRFLQLSVLNAATVLPNGGRTACAYAPDELLHLLGPESVRELGRRYREIMPVTELFAVPPWQSSAATGVRDDFARGRTVVIQGWVLSVTEARQCALFSLLS